MSFILDALKKSESERHRHSGPVLMDVRIAAPRRRVPVWAWVIAAVLLVNLAVLGWALWVAPEKVPAAAEAPAATVPSAAASGAPATTAPAPALPASPLPEPTLSTAAPSQAIPPQTAPTQSMPDAPPAAPPNAFAPGNASTSIDVSTLPRVQDMLAAGVTLPQLSLNLHVFDPQPANRYVLLNGKRMREGDSTAEGAKLVQITATGLVLEWRGRRLFLPAGG